VVAEVPSTLVQQVDGFGMSAIVAGFYLVRHWAHRLYLRRLPMAATAPHGTF
jgi:hypothetical protein